MPVSFMAPVSLFRGQKVPFVLGATKTQPINKKSQSLRSLELSRAGREANGSGEQFGGIGDNPWAEKGMPSSVHLHLMFLGEVPDFP